MDGSRVGRHQRRAEDSPVRREHRLLNTDGMCDIKEMFTLEIAVIMLWFCSLKVSLAVHAAILVIQ